MNLERFDDLARAVASEPSRRQVFKLLGRFAFGSVGVMLGGKAVQAASPPRKCIGFGSGIPSSGTCAQNHMQCSLSDGSACCIPCQAEPALAECRRIGGQLTGQCPPNGCPGDLVRCHGICVDPRFDPLNCGNCGHVCPKEFPDCCQTSGAAINILGPGICVNKQTDPLNCGGCGLHCRRGELCVDGQCMCPPGTTYCESAGDIFNHCVDAIAFQYDADNCGVCGHVCPAGATCLSGRCLCPESTTPCGTDAHGDPIRCCPTGQICGDPTRGDCSCPSNTTPCRTFSGQIASCCPAGQSCINGTCSGCPTGQRLCGDTCVDVFTDSANCGDCGFTCPTSTTCQTGHCVSTCDTPTATCNELTNPICPGSQVCSFTVCVDPACCIQGTYPFLNGDPNKQLDPRCCTGVSTLDGTCIHFTPFFGPCKFSGQCRPGAICVGTTCSG
jgi:hypothetical protein